MIAVFGMIGWNKTKVSVVLSEAKFEDVPIDGLVYCDGETYTKVTEDVIVNPFGVAYNFSRGGIVYQSPNLFFIKGFRT